MWQDRFKIRLFGVITIILLCISCTVKSFQNDTFYMIKLGEDILKYGVDMVDHYSWIGGLSYTYPHWLYDIFLYFIHSNFGEFGIYVSTIGLFIVLILTIYIVQLKVNKNEFLSLFIAVISISTLYGFATARSQLLTATLYLLEVYFIEKLIKSGKYKYIIYLSLISLVVANIHATIWMFTFVLYLPFIGSYFVDKLFKIKSKRVIIEDIKNIKLVIISFVISFIMGLFSPSRICYTYIFRVMMGVSQSYIIEHAPLVVIKHPLFIIYILIFVIVLMFSKIRVYLYEVFMIGGLIFMSLMSGRHLIFFYTIGVIYISRIIIRYLKEKKDNSLDILGSMLVRNKIIYISCYIVVGCLFMYKYNEIKELEYIPDEYYPKGVVSYIKENRLDDMRLYNDYNYGSYLLYNDIEVFIDSRCDLYLPEFNGKDYNIFLDDMEIVNDYEEKFSFYNFSHVLVNKEEVLYKILINDSNYKELYKDKYFVLYERINYEEE